MRAEVIVGDWETFKGNTRRPWCGKRVACSGNEVPDSIDLRVHLEDLLRSRADSIMQSEGAAGHHFQHFDSRGVSPVS